MVAEEDGKHQPLVSCVPPEFTRSKVLLILKLAQPSPRTSSLPHSHEHCLRRLDPGEKGNLLLSALPQKAAVPSRLGSGGSRQAARRGASQAATQRWLSQLCGQSPRGCRQGLQLEHPPFFLGTGMACTTVSQRGAFPASFPHSRDPLLTLIPRQETAPRSQPNPLLGRGGCTAGSQPPGFTGLAGKAPPASLLQIQPVPPPRPLPEAPGFHSVGGSR